MAATVVDSMVMFMRIFTNGPILNFLLISKKK
uniref:7TM_GPCR_Srx domain-containing protein n=1 Tax=Heterorhabditis bacteriophora TaxID=37862 RepID=A0A1I7WK25_HETBA